ncbi:MAG: tRNA epoxyqueuosine(34) reductase QueG [Myxococcaceae bacterium]
MDSKKAQVTVLSALALSALAKSTGFSLCGFARAEPIPSEVLGTWLDAGFAADMDWMKERLAERLDVRRLLPEAETVMVMACGYQTAQTAPSLVASYAQGRDYHYTLHDRLRAVRRGLRQMQPGIRFFDSVDHGPVMEKVWAVRAGLGFVGKSGCLITPEFGTYVVLCTLILGASVDAYASTVAADRCGKCRLCIEACPTDAILPERRVDARACISYQSIENSGAVPDALRMAFSSTVLGCDICQTVCPLNEDVAQVDDARFMPRPAAGLTAREFASLTPEAFREVAKGTPLMRPGYDGIRRNAAYALGAMRDDGARDILQALSADEHAGVREAALWALAQLESKSAA